MKKLLAATLVCSLAACTTTDPYTGENKTSNSTAGAVIGAVAGAAVGVASSSKKDRGKGALTGAVAGGAIGGGVGYYMDKQETELRQQLQGSGVQVQRNGDQINLIMPGNITFETGKYDIRPQFHDVLDSVATVLVEFNKTAVNIGGHTDSTGSDDFNQLLSERRAQSVRDYLGQRKVAYNRMNATGYGPRYPVANNSSSAGREQNRRVEIQLSPL
ncbi:OmpA family protein [uncultured Gilvimarinus sp.]|uniref:OmpA family protein n=1 Tax=uncultured Gilvimarinus sp. TaxID=1689143 RepID=UPI0030EE6978